MSDGNECLECGRDTWGDLIVWHYSHRSGMYEPMHAECHVSSLTVSTVAGPYGYGQ